MTEDRFGTEPALWRSVGRGAALGLAIGAALELICLLSHIPSSPVLILGMPVAGLALLQLVRSSISETPPPEPVTQPIVIRPEYFVRLRQLERRLDSASRDPSNFDWVVRPMLAELAADRLKYKHGINFHREPAKAREVVGEQLWQIMITSPDTPIQPVSPARLRELVQAISHI
ncbi:MAG: hypothetical protein ACJ74U_18210 [Jatrophihabitantaceae bacterium]